MHETFSEKALLEWVTDGKMYSKILEESAGDIVVSLSGRIIREMERDTEVETEHEDIHVVADADAGSKGNLFRECLEAELRVGARFITVVREFSVFAEQPYVS